MSSIPLPFPVDDPHSSGLESITELTARIKRALRAGFSEVAVHGEVSNVARPRSGHVYFTLKDDGASIRAVLWKTEARKLSFDLTDGMAVRAFGSLTLYEPRGEYQITVSQIEPEGIGALELAFRQRFAKLSAEGLFDPARKRQLPRYPRRILVVTSPTGAAVRDLLQVTYRRWKCAQVLIVPSRVQGIGADREVVAAIALANRVRDGDVIVVARGGGSLEDLWTFNEESVVRAVVGSRLPVVSAVGHEIDVTLTDLAADRRALTPSEAGEICAPDSREVALHLDRLASRLSHAGSMQLANARTRLERLSDRAIRALHQGLLDRRHRLARLATGLEAMSPLGVLSRGYSLTFRAENGELIRAASNVSPGELIKTQLAAGSLISRVVEG
jgi:exodeoxyribonuclease VII large subunit